MSWQATAWALQTQTGSPSTKLTLLGLANYADENGVCWPTQERLAKETEQSIDTVQRRIKKLVEIGLVRVERRANRRGQWSGKIYYLNMGVAEMTKPQSAVRSKHERGKQEAPPPCRTENGAHAATSTPTMPQALRHKPSLEHLRKPSAPNAAVSAAERLQAFEGRQEGSEVVQNRIAQRIGPDGWLILGELSAEHRANLTTLERRGHLDDRTLNAAILNARCAQPP